MANYITPTDPLSQRTCHTVGVHTTHAWHGEGNGGVFKTAVQNMAQYSQITCFRG